MVWVHGGGFCGGTGSDAWEHGVSLARSAGAVVVTLNYRLGPLGFLALPELMKTYGASGGMNGINDQLTALRWVQRHVPAFGGNPHEVSLMGESSGGVSVCVLNASPRGRGLFRRAVIQSGPCIVPSEGWGPHTMGFGYSMSIALAASLRAPTLAELRKLAPQQLQWDNATLWSDNFAGYFFDGGVLSAFPEPVYRSGHSNADELLVGHTSMDGTAAFYSSAPLANATSAMWASAMHRRWGEHAARVMAQYPLARYANATYMHYDVPAVTASYIEADADERVECPSRAMAELAAKASKATQGAPPVYFFEFAHTDLRCDPSFELQMLPWWRPRDRLAGSGWASHGAEVRYLMNTTHGPDGLAPLLKNDSVRRQDCAMNADERRLAKDMAEMWGSFARGKAPWVAFMAAAAAPGSGGPATTRTLQIRAAGEGGSVVRTDLNKDDCEFWSSLKSGRGG